MIQVEAVDLNNQGQVKRFLLERVLPESAR